MTNATNATSGESPSQSREQAKQTEGEKEQAKTGAEEQALAGTPEVTNMTNATNATSGESPSQSREQAKQTEGEKEQAKTGAEEQALAGTPEVTNMTNATNATAPQPLRSSSIKRTIPVCLTLLIQMTGTIILKMAARMNNPLLDRIEYQTTQ